MANDGQQNGISRATQRDSARQPPGLAAGDLLVVRVSAQRRRGAFSAPTIASSSPASASAARATRSAWVRAVAERQRQDPVRHRRQPRSGAAQRRRVEERPRLQARIRSGHAARVRRQGHRRRHHRDAEPLACARHHLGAPGGQARVCREARVRHGVEGRKMVEAQARFSGDCPGGDDEPQPAVRAAIKFMQDGGIGKVYMARGLCFKPRPSIGRFGWSDGAGREVRGKLRPSARRSTCRWATTRSTCPRSTTTCGLGPAEKRPFNRNRFHYNWHWQWDDGNGDTGNQGPHQFDIARWQPEQEHPVKISSVGGYFGPESQQETPDMQTAFDPTRLRHDPRNPRRRAHERRGRTAHRQPVLRRRAGCGLTRPAAAGSPTWAHWE